MEIESSGECALSDFLLIEKLDIDEHYVDRLYEYMAHIDKIALDNIRVYRRTYDGTKLRSYYPSKKDVEMMDYFVSLFPPGFATRDNLNFNRLSGSFLFDPHMDIDRNVTINILLRGPTARTLIMDECEENDADFYSLNENKKYGKKNGYYKIVGEYVQQPGESYLLKTNRIHAVEKTYSKYDRVTISLQPDPKLDMTFEKLYDFFE